MEMLISDLGDVRKVTLSGRMDAAGISEIETRFSAAIIPRGKPAVVDMTGVPFMASLGIRLLVSVTRALANKRARIALFGVTAGVRDVMEMTSLDKIIPIAATEDEAMALVTG